jgi:hypothetical protein
VRRYRIFGSRMVGPRNSAQPEATTLGEAELSQLMGGFDASEAAAAKQQQQQQQQQQEEAAAAASDQVSG